MEESRKMAKIAYEALDEKKGEDMSGKMPYCSFCKYKYYKLSMCTVTQEEREEKCLCATAYNRMQRD